MAAEAAGRRSRSRRAGEGRGLKGCHSQLASTDHAVLGRRAWDLGVFSNMLLFFFEKLVTCYWAPSFRDIVRSVGRVHFKCGDNQTNRLKRATIFLFLKRTRFKTPSKKIKVQPLLAPRNQPKINDVETRLYPSFYLIWNRQGLLLEKNIIMEHWNSTIFGHKNHMLAIRVSS